MAVEILDQGADRELAPGGVGGELARGHAQEVQAEVRANREETAAELGDIGSHRDRELHDIDGRDQEVYLGNALRAPGGPPPFPPSLYPPAELGLLPCHPRLPQ